MLLYILAESHVLKFVFTYLSNKRVNNDIPKPIPNFHVAVLGGKVSLLCYLPLSFCKWAYFTFAVLRKT